MSSFEHEPSNSPESSKAFTNKELTTGDDIVDRVTADYYSKVEGGNEILESITDKSDTDNEYRNKSNQELYRLSYDNDMNIRGAALSEKSRRDFIKIDEDRVRDADRPRREAEYIAQQAAEYKKWVQEQIENSTKNNSELRTELGLSPEATEDQVEAAWTRRAVKNMGKYALSMVNNFRNPLRLFTQYHMDKAVDGEKYNKEESDKAWVQYKQEEKDKS